MRASRFLLAIACAVAFLLPGTVARATPQAPAASSVVVIGAAGLTLSDLGPERTPHLWSAIEQGASANLAVRTLTPATCAAAGWLSLGAGDRMLGVDLTPDWLIPLLAHTSCPRMVDPVQESAGGGDDPGAAGIPLETGPAVFPDFERVVHANAGSGYPSDPGVFTRAAASEDFTGAAPSDGPGSGTGEAAEADPTWCTAAYGRGAAYAAADADGRVAHWAPATALTADPEGTSAAVPWESCALTLIDAGTAADQQWEPNAWYGWNDEALGRTRTGQIAELDDRVGRILQHVPDTADVIIAGVGDADYPSRLRALIALGPSYEAGVLRSSSTRQPGLVQLTDVLPAALAAAGLESEGTSPARYEVDTSANPVLAPGADGDAASSEAAEARFDRLVADSRKAGTVHSHAQTFSILLDVTHYLLTLMLGIVLLVPVVRALRDRVPRAVRAVRRGGVWACFVLGLVPMGSFLAGVLPWGRMPNPGWGLTGAIAVGTAALVGVSLAGPWRRTWWGRVAAVSLVSAVVLVVDVAVGSRLQFNALMGYNPIVAGRFYGLGNQGAALFLVSALLGLGIVAARLQNAGRAGLARLLVAGFGLAGVFVLGNPAWGAKFGGTVAALVGFTVLLLALFRVRVSLVRLVLIGAGALAIIVGVAGLDALRPPAERSHFGNFFVQAVDGELLAVIGRKLEANLRIMVINPGLAIIVPLAVVTVLFSLAYLQRFSATARLASPWVPSLVPALQHPTVHAGFLSTVISLGVGLVITDSGVAVPATGAMMVVPMLVALSADDAPLVPAGPAASAALAGSTAATGPESPAATAGPTRDGDA